jgi:hypothetical protein
MYSIIDRIFYSKLAKYDFYPSEFAQESSVKVSSSSGAGLEGGAGGGYSTSPDGKRGNPGAGGSSRGTAGMLAAAAADLSLQDAATRKALLEQEEADRYGLLLFTFELTN